MSAAIDLHMHSIFSDGTDTLEELLNSVLVRGIRTDTIEEKPIVYVANDAFRIEPLLVTPCVAAPMLFVLLIHLLVKYRDPTPTEKKKKKGDSKNAP